MSRHSKMVWYTCCTVHSYLQTIPCWLTVSPAVCMYTLCMLLWYFRPHLKPNIASKAVTKWHLISALDNQGLAKALVIQSQYHTHQVANWFCCQVAGTPRAHVWAAWLVWLTPQRDAWSQASLLVLLIKHMESAGTRDTKLLNAAQSQMQPCVFRHVCARTASGPLFYFWIRH